MESIIELTRNNLHTDDAKIEICQFLDDAKITCQNFCCKFSYCFLPYPTLGKKVDMHTGKPGE